MKQKSLLKTMLLLCALVVGSSNVWADDVTWTHEFTSPEAISNNSITVDGATWSISTVVKKGSPTIDKGNSYSKYCLKFGSGANNCYQTVTFSTDYFTSYNVKSVTVQVLHNVSKSGTLTATQGNTTIGTKTETIGTSWTDMTVNTTAGSGGTLSFTYSPTDCAVNIHSITVVYTTSGGGGSDPSISLSTYSVTATTAEKEGTIDVTYNNIDSPDAEVLFYESDGTTPASYNWVLADIEGNDNHLYYYISANTGAARAAYMKIHQKNTDIYSAKISITQDAVVVEPPTFSPEPVSNTYYLEGMGITLTSAGNSIRYTMTTDGTNPSQSIANSTLYTGPIPLSNGTNKIWAIAIDEYGNRSSGVTKTYNAKAPATLPFSWTGTSSAGKADLATKTGVLVTLPSDYDVQHAPYRLKFDAEGKNVTIFTDGKPETLYFTAKIFNASSSSKMKVQASTNGAEFRDVQEFEVTGDAGATFEFTTTTAFASTDRVVKLVMSSKQSGVNVAVGTISVSCLPVKISSAKYATFSNAHVLDFSNTGITVYTATDHETSVTLNEVTTGKVPANTPVVLYKADAIDGTSINVPVIASAAAISGTNDLRVSTGTDVDYMYVLAMNPTIGFYPWGGTNLSAGKVYLLGHASYGARDFIGFGEETKISTVGSKTADVRGEYFNLSGQRVNQPTKGLYIVNGKKVVIK